MLKSPIITMGSSGNSLCRPSKALGKAQSTCLRSTQHGMYMDPTMSGVKRVDPNTCTKVQNGVDLPTGVQLNLVDINMATPCCNAGRSPIAVKQWYPGMQSCQSVARSCVSCNAMTSHWVCCNKSRRLVCMCCTPLMLKVPMTKGTPVVSAGGVACTTGTLGSADVLLTLSQYGI